MADDVPDTGADAGEGPDFGSTASLARWQKMVGLAGLIVLVVVGVLLATGDHSPGRHAPSGQSAAPIDGAPEIEVEGIDLTFQPDEITMTAFEPVNIVFTASDVEHDFVVDEIGFHVHADRGETATAGLMVDEPGEYLAYCSVPGHRQAGMEATLVVAASSEEEGGHSPPDWAH